jgi:hypothetical protein
MKYGTENVEHKAFSSVALTRNFENVPRTEKYSEKVFLCIRNTVRRSSDVSETQ